MKTDLNFFEEVHSKEQKRKKSSWLPHSLNFKHGLIIGACCVLGIFLIGSFRNGNQHERSKEMLALHLDSIQIQQNDRMIELLELHSKRDTTIIHIVSPAL